MAQSTLRVFPRAGRPRCLYKVRAFGAVAHFHSSSLPFFPQPALLPCVRAGVVYGRVSCAVLSLSMASLHVTRVSTAVWKWFCRCPDIIGPVYDTSSDEEFFTPPTSPPPSSEQERVAVTTESPTAYISPTHGVQNLLSPSQALRLRRRHAAAVRQLTSPPPVVKPAPQAPLKAYQRPVKVFRPSWAP